MYDVAIVGGGLAGLVNAIHLRKEGFTVLVIERKTYPFHRVCGEYISNEVVPYLEALNIFPDELAPASITKFLLTAPSGKGGKLPLDLGGFGVSRYQLDYFLYQKAVGLGVVFKLGHTVEHVTYHEPCFTLKIRRSNSVQSRMVTGAFGKRSLLDTRMKRPFTCKEAPFFGVKYHIRYNFPDDTVALHNFEGGYCGLSSVEGNRYNLCFLGSSRHLQELGSIEAVEEQVLRKNPYLDEIYREAEFLMDRPQVISKVSFQPKLPVENHILMVGDTAGLISPLCGNGMAMAIHAAKIAAEYTALFLRNKISRQEAEARYAANWKQLFVTRLWVGRNTQQLFINRLSAELAVMMVRHTRPLARKIMKYTHGQPFTLRE